MSQKVFAKILEIQKAVKAVKKDSRSYNYEYVSGDKLLDLVRPKMDELGLLLLPEVVSVKTTPVTYGAWNKQAQAVVNTTENLVEVEMRMTWVDVESGETYTAPWHGSGQNGFDKGFGSALTYAERYYLLKLFHLSTNKDDVDAIAKERDEAVEKAAATVATDVPRPGKAPATPAAAPRCATLEELKNDPEFWQWAESETYGKLSKAGKPAREAFISKYHPTPEQLEYFDGVVATKKDILGGNV